MLINERTGQPELSEEEKQSRLNLIAGLREIADFYESRPNLPAAYGVNLSLVATSKAELASLVRAAGSLKKVEAYSPDNMKLSRMFGPIGFHILANKNDTCERVKVGEEIVPAKPARTVELPAEPEKVVERYEWRCPDSILATSEA